jgi:hypothetical protein
MVVGLLAACAPEEEPPRGGLVELMTRGRDHEPEREPEPPAARPTPKPDRDRGCTIAREDLAAATTEKDKAVSTLVAANVCALMCERDPVANPTACAHYGVRRGGMRCFRLCDTTTGNPRFRAAACANAGKPVPAEPAAEPALRRGDRVKVKFLDGRWYAGTVTTAWSDGTVDVAYDDGDRSRALPASKAQFVKRPVWSAPAN